MAAPKPLTILGARAGEGSHVRSVWPQEVFDGVLLRCRLDWTKGDQNVGVARLSPKDARRLAVQLLQAAQLVEDRMEYYP